MTPQPGALAGVETVLVTHEHFDHFDHFDPERLRGCDSAVYTCAGVVPGT
ncbi:hypothetical protein ACFW1M_28565 [Streptomyces inhibens]